MAQPFLLTGGVISTIVSKYYKLVSILFTLSVAALKASSGS
jgi:hypothetical protein